MNRRQWPLPETLMSPEQAAHTLRVMGGDKIKRALALEIAEVIDNLRLQVERADAALISCGALICDPTQRN